MIHVCSLAKLHETVEITGARHVITLVNGGTVFTRPSNVDPPTTCSSASTTSSARSRAW